MIPDAKVIAETLPVPQTLQGAPSKLFLPLLVIAPRYCVGNKICAQIMLMVDQVTD